MNLTINNQPRHTSFKAAVKINDSRIALRTLKLKPKQYNESLKLKVEDLIGNIPDDGGFSWKTKKARYVVCTNKYTNYLINSLKKLGVRFKQNDRDFLQEWKNDRKVPYRQMREVEEAFKRAPNKAAQA